MMSVNEIVVVFSVSGQDTTIVFEDVSYSVSAAGTIDEEVKRIIDECYANAKSIIQKYDRVLHACADLLLEKEKITREEFEALFDGE